MLFAPAGLFLSFLILFIDHSKLSISENFPYFAWQFHVIIVTGIVATIGGFLDWRFHRKTLNMKISRKERIVEAIALGLGGLPMFFLMWFAMVSTKPFEFLIPIILVLIFTVSAICYDEFIFHKKRCGNLENLYHKMLIFGNGIAWLAWFHFIYVR
ncbi:hypothetical protein [Leptospira kanakyensis]|uniref:hypothetical protein n=1 Tax=Leptospira kanakyensis TaxID=2484968 RepID=UPI00223E1FE8|nr:hypothetical protein [Leptospira kanakyensis]MCW7469268.1 hypothetical protein [Leptospira kanakyensis]